MSKNEFKLYTENFASFRDLLRHFFIYGFYSKEDFQKHEIMKIRSFEDNSRRIVSFNSGELIERRKDKKKYLSFQYDYYKNHENFIAEFYKLKKYTKNQIVAFFILQALLNKQEDWLCCDDILKLLWKETDETVDFDKQTLTNHLDKLSEFGLIEKRKVKNMFCYKKSEDKLRTLNINELNELYQAVCFFQGISFPSVPGYFLKETLEKYIKYERKEHKPENQFSFRFQNLHPILEEDIVFSMAEAISKRNKIEIEYHNPKGLIENYSIIPIVIVHEKDSGRTYLLAAQEDIFIYRVDRIRTVKTIKESITEGVYSSLRDKVDEYLEQTWNVGALEYTRAKRPIVVKFYKQKNAAFDYVTERLTREGIMSKVIEETEDYIVASLEVSDYKILKPWIRSFHGNAEVLSTELRDEIEKEWRETLEAYGHI